MLLLAFDNTTQARQRRIYIEGPLIHQLLEYNVSVFQDWHFSAFDVHLAAVERLRFVVEVETRHSDALFIPLGDDRITPDLIRVADMQDDALLENVPLH